MRTNAKQRPNQQKADATEQQTTADPKTRDTSTGTGASHHPIHTHTHTHTYNTGGGGRAGPASTGILRRPVQSAAEGTRPGGGGGEEREALSRMLDRIVRKHQPADSSSSPTKIVSPRSGKKKAGEALSKRQQEQQICVENMFVLAEALEEVRVSSLQREAVEKKCADAAAAYERYRSV